MTLPSLYFDASGPSARSDFFSVWAPSQAAQSVMAIDRGLISVRDSTVAASRTVAPLVGHW